MTDRQVILITGTRTGIGRFLAEHYLARGLLVEGCSRQEPDWSHDSYVHHLLDVSDESKVRDMVSSIRKRHGRLDAIINNAGIASMNHVMLTPVSTLDRIFAVNMRGTFLVCREGSKLMKSRNSGRIINMGTVAVPMKLEGEAMYAASKAAVVSFTEILARELAPFGITCNVVGPPPIETDIIRAVPRAKIDAIINSMAIRRLGTFEDVANVTDFFLRPESDYITGQTIYLGGP